MSNRALVGGGAIVFGGVSYYLYSAGGNPKLAEKKFEHDIATATRRTKEDFPGQDKEAKKAGEEAYEAARVKAQELSNQAKAAADKADAKFDAYRNDAEKKLAEEKAKIGAKVNEAANQFDKKAYEATNTTKSWFGGFFGSGGK